jgi:hypothetical protein
MVIYYVKECVLYVHIYYSTNKTYLCTMCNCVCIIQTSTDDIHCGENVYAVSGQKSSAEAGIRLSFSPLLLTEHMGYVLYGISCLSLSLGQ